MSDVQYVGGGPPEEAVEDTTFYYDTDAGVLYFYVASGDTPGWRVVDLSPIEP